MISPPALLEGHFALGYCRRQTGRGCHHKAVAVLDKRVPLIARHRLAGSGLLTRDARPEMLVLATGTGSLIASHVNDPGFWMVQSFFKMELKKTLATWTVMETVISVAGLGAVLVAAWVVG